MYNVRVKFLANVVQIRVYSEFVYGGKKLSKKKKTENPFTEKLENIRTFDELEEAQKRSASVSRTRSINKIYDLSRNNNWDWFFTLTFNPDKVDSFDYSFCTKKLSDWLSNMKRKCPEMKYLVVPEQHKSGRWHFHGLFANCDGLNFVDSGLVDKSGRIIYNVDNYRLGWSTATKVTDSDKASSYMCKYITKNLCDVTKGKKRYWASRNLDEPMTYEFISKSRKVLDFCMSQEDVYAKTVHSEYADVHYLEIPIYKTNPYLSNRCISFYDFIQRWD